jgi:hypothetical protein
MGHLLSLLSGGMNVFIVALLRNCNNFALSIVAATLTLLGQGDLAHATPPRKHNINPSDIETSDAQREHGKMTFENSCMIGTDLMVYHDEDDDEL